MSNAQIYELPGDRPSPVTEPLLRTVIGDVLRQARLDQKRTLKDVADAAQVSIPYLSEIERGRKEASSEVLSAVCRSLGVPLLDLIALAHRQIWDLQMLRPIGLGAARMSAPSPAPLAAPAAPGAFSFDSVRLMAA